MNMSVIIAAVFIILVDVVFSNNSTFNIPTPQYQALSDLYYATNGPSWEWQTVNEASGVRWNFTGLHNPCLENWQGILCNSFCESTGNCVVENIFLRNYSMSGTIPPSISNITTLNSFNLIGNQLVGSIPDLSNLKDLRYLDLQNNNLTGTFPLSVCNLQHMTYLDLANNQLSGSIPNAVANMTHLVQLFVAFNHLNGSIPSGLSRLRYLEQLIFKYNELTGTIPAELGDLNSLKYITVSRNHLDGTIPPQLSALNDLFFLDLSHNNLTGSVPPSFALLTNLTFLVLNHNGLTGEITSDMVLSWNNMHDFYLNDNQFSGPLPGIRSDGLYYYEIDNNMFTSTVPPYMFRNSHLNYFSMGNNLITGTIPDTLGSSVNVEYIAMNENLLSGPIPGGIGQLRYLIDLLLYSNMLSGSLPSGMQQLHLVESLMLQDNRLTGTLHNLVNNSAPTSFISRMNVSGYNATNYQIISSIDVSQNSFTGTIPPQIFSLTRLLTFAAVSNCLSGALPLNICNATTVTSLALDGLSTASACHQQIFPNTRRKAYLLAYPMEDAVPWCMLSLPNLQSLHLSGNGITGTIPSDVVLGPNLTELTLSHNKLTGSIPMSIQQRSWTNLGLSYNKLNGIIHESFARSGPNSAISMNVNRLSGHIPLNITDAINIDVLEGSIFSCQYDKSDVPRADHEYENYSCGSNEFYLSAVVWSIAMALYIIFIAIGVLQYRSNNSCLGNCGATQYISHLLHKCVEWMATFDVQPLENFGEYSVHSVFAFGRHCSDIRYRVLVATVLMTCLYMPAYTLLSTRYQTFAFLYGWTASAMFKSGEVCAYAMLVGFSLSLGVMIFVKERRMGKNDKVEKQRTVKLPWSRVWKQRLAFAAGITPALLINNGTMVGVNIAYIYISQNYGLAVVSVTQFVLAAFKLLWNEYAVRSLISISVLYIKNDESVADLERASDISLMRAETVTFLREIKEAIPFRTFVILFNNIITPFLAFIVVSPVCFYNIFFTQLPVLTSYNLCLGVVGTANTRCKNSALTTFQTSYIPPFTYSYQCSSTFVQNYASMYVFMFLLSAFVHPVMHILNKMVFDRTCKSTSTLGKMAFRVSNYFLLPLLRELPKDVNALLERRNRKTDREMEDERELDALVNATHHNSTHTHIRKDSTHGAKLNLKVRIDEHQQFGSGSTDSQMSDVSDNKISPLSADGFQPSPPTSPSRPLPPLPTDCESVEQADHITRKSSIRLFRHSSVQQKRDSTHLGDDQPASDRHASRTLSARISRLRSSTRSSAHPSTAGHSSMRFSHVGHLLSAFLARTQQENAGAGRVRTIFFSKSRFTLHLTTDMALLLTFGMVFPPLAVMICVSVFSYTVFVQLLMGRFLTLAQKHKDYLRIKKVLEAECSGSSAQIKESFSLLVIFAAIFYSLFLFDTLGDVLGALNSAWIAILMAGMPFAIKCCYIMGNRLSTLLNNMHTAKKQDRRSRNDPSPSAARLSTLSLHAIPQSNSIISRPSISAASMHRPSSMVTPSVYDLELGERHTAGDISRYLATVSSSRQNSVELQEGSSVRAGDLLCSTSNPVHDDKNLTV